MALITHKVRRISVHTHTHTRTNYTPHTFRPWCGSQCCEVVSGLQQFQWNVFCSEATLLDGRADSGVVYWAVAALRGPTHVPGPAKMGYSVVIVPACFTTKALRIWGNTLTSLTSVTKLKLSHVHTHTHTHIQRCVCQLPLFYSMNIHTDIHCFRRIHSDVTSKHPVLILGMCASRQKRTKSLQRFLNLNSSWEVGVSCSSLASPQGLVAWDCSPWQL